MQRLRSPTREGSEGGGTMQGDVQLLGDALEIQHDENWGAEYSMDQQSAKQWFRSTRTRFLLALVGVLFIVVIATSVSLITGSASCKDPPATSKAVPECEGTASACGKNGAVSTTNEHATRAGIQILKRGGNAVDAAVAVQLALNVVQPQSTGIGGGCFILYFNASSKETVALDGREEAPAAFTSNMFCKNTDCIRNDTCECTEGAWEFDERDTGTNPVGVPGTVYAMTRLLENFGTMTLAEVAQPAVELARRGFPMYADLHDLIVQNKQRLARFNSSAALFLSDKGNAVPVGATFRNPDLADTIERLAAMSRDEFYNGQIADDIIHAIEAYANPITGLPGVMTKADLASYKAVFRPVVEYSYRNWSIQGVSLPDSGGPTLAMILNNLAQFDMSSFKPESIELFHRLIDAQDMAFADRNMYMGDPDFVDVNIAGLLSKAYSQSRVQQYSKATTSAGAPIPAGTPPGSTIEWAADPQNPKHGTTHFNVVDKDGNLISWTTTIEENLGSAVVVPHRGFLLNNELTDFTALGSDPVSQLPYANRPQGGKMPRRTAVGADANSMGGKRPISSMTPTIVLDSERRPILSLGSPGGSRIIGTVLHVLTFHLDLGLSLSDATKAYRIISRNDIALAELGLYSEAPQVLSGLQQRGFNVTQYITGRPLGYVQSLRIRPDDTSNQRFAAMADTWRLPTALALAY